RPGAMHRNSTQGFSLLELVVSLTLVAVLVGVFLDRVMFYREQAEKSAMEQVANDLRSSVNLRVAELALDNRFAELAALPGQNPMELLARKPQNYLGVLDSARVQEVVTGNWYFDITSKEVVYYIDSGRYFVPDDQGRMRVAWRVKLEKGVGGAAAPQWARLELVQPYRWF
ncbi:MAG TPA: type II secretion system protein, partial [Candidatus Dormibacteraeota bacterium]|nr:type II secretion system protein [Candidatus Dormibacteraeota bacterium]